MYASPAQKSTHPAEHGVRKRELPIGRPFRHAPQNGTLLTSIVSTGSAGRAGRFFGASAQKNQFRVSKTRAGREFVRSTAPAGRFQHCIQKRLDLGPCSLNMLIHQNHSFFSKTSRRNRFIVRPSGAKVHVSCGAWSAEKGSCPLAGRFAMLRKTGRFLGEARRGPLPPSSFHRIDRLCRSGGAIFRSVRAEKSIPHQ